MPESMTDAYRSATTRQMPNLPSEWIDALDGEWSAEPGKAYLHQTGGWVMCVACDNRLLSEDDAIVVYAYDPEDEDDEEGTLLYRGDDPAAAWNTLLNG